MKKISYRASAFIRFLLKSKTKHDAHSPYLFKFIEEVFESKDSPTQISELLLFKKKLLKNNLPIHVFDFGTGSEKYPEYTTSIRNQAKRSLKSDKEVHLFNRLTHWFKPQIVIELGTSFGITTMAIAKASPDGIIYTLEGCPNTSGIAKSAFNQFQCTNINLVTGNINDTLNLVLSDLTHVDLAFIDANHNFKNTLEYYFKIKPLLNRNSLIIFDDIHWSKGLNRAWNEIILDDDIRLSVETWNLGFAFLNPDLSKQHFVLRK